MMTREAAAAYATGLANRLSTELYAERGVAAARRHEIEAIVTVFVLAVRQLDASESDGGAWAEMRNLVLTLGEVLYVLGYVDGRKAAQGGDA